MYHNFYKLKENPFNMTADPDFFFSSRSHNDALSNLIYGIEQRKGIMVLTGEVGTGKTTLCRRLIKQFNSKTRFALVLNPNFSEVQLLQIIIHDLGIPVSTTSTNKFSLIQILNDFLVSQSFMGNNIVIIIDESQNLSVTQLEQIRLLSNIETDKEKLLQIVLVGQPELYEKLQLLELRQLRQRIAVHYHLRPLEKADVHDYIHHRLMRAIINPIAEKTVKFTERAVELIYNYTLGSPRSINILCDRALLAGFTHETFSIDETIIEDCAKEVLHW